MEQNSYPKGIFLTIAIIVVVLGIVFWVGRNQAVSPKNVEGEQTSAASALSSANNGTQNQNDGGILSASETSYDFGTISMKDGKVTKEFTVTNASESDVLVRSVITSCMCTVAYVVRPDGSAKGPFGMPGHGGIVPPANETIKSGETRTIRVVFDPNAHGPAGVGPFVRQIALSDATGKSIQLEIKGNVRP